MSDTVKDEEVTESLFPTDLEAGDGFGSEFRKLARQRRFERTLNAQSAEVAETVAVEPEVVETEAAEPVAAVHSPAPAPAPVKTPAPAKQPAPAPAADLGLPAVEALLSSARRAARLNVTQPPMRPATPPQAAPTPVAQPQPPVAAVRTDNAAAIAELSRLAERVVDARERLVIERARADRAEAENAILRDRLMAARGLVHDAQRAASDAAERAAWLEGRCTALEDALDKSLSSSLLSRWRWRRAMRTRSAS